MPKTIDDLLAEAQIKDVHLRFCRAILSRFTVTWHNTGNQLVEVYGEAAWAEHYTISSHRIAADEAGPERDARCSSISCAPIRFPRASRASVPSGERATEAIRPTLCA